MRLYLIYLYLLARSVYAQQNFQSLIVVANTGSQYSPIRLAAQLISTNPTDSVRSCVAACNNNILCRVFDYGVNHARECRLFEGDTENLGTIIPSTSPTSIVGTVNISPDLFAARGQQCSSACPQNRYLRCNAGSTCDCIAHTYWHSGRSMCLAQSPVLGASCSLGLNNCREDLHYTCLQFRQCGRKYRTSGNHH